MLIPHVILLSTVTHLKQTLIQVLFTGSCQLIFSDANGRCENTGDFIRFYTLADDNKDNVCTP